ncbi:class I SAM-dependent methyltransferase [Bosea caraganae]|uniref:Class I SAM-dependent methyltransferase n=1 Tax=Bosea caraganae TaxID=2763117 RepID=A0A370L3F2_9HYPH|nr:class I SAM-dependent methyltransferase [Bosea caraganae]RDJ22974.1 class I SAM-dependent methyltransferase [Bosea caraganae]RDJ28754.1 class I SAM-dependent methyltransferase [Bosea caraganae]
MSWVERLACPICQHDLRSVGEDRVRCSSCGVSYPVLHDTPILVANVKFDRRDGSPNPATIDALVKNIIFDETKREELTECYRSTFTFDNKIIQTEADQFLNRLRSDGLVIPEPWPKTDAEERTVTAAIDNKNARANLELLCPPAAVRPGELFSTTVKLRNVGETSISSTGDLPFHLSYSWADVETDQLRTKLLIDLPPGRQISMPVVVKAPAVQGILRLSLLPVIEGVRWATEASASCVVDVNANAAGTLSTGWPVSSEVVDYMGDHFNAVARLKAWLAKRTWTSPPRILEIGGNFHPMMRYMDNVEAYNLDIDPFGLMTASIHQNSGGQKIHNVVADGNMLPFHDNFFDAIVMFATLHHFPEPQDFLGSIKPKLKADGFLGLFCEPVGHIFYPDIPHGYLEEIKRGVYEQSFMPWEYRSFLHQEGFRVCDAAIEYGSLKLIAMKS